VWRFTKSRLVEKAHKNASSRIETFWMVRNVLQFFIHILDYFNFSEICSKSYTTKTSLQQHETSQHKKNIKQEDNEVGKQIYKCPKCSKQLQRGGQVFAMHVSNCNGILTEKRVSYHYSCFECEKKFVTRLACADHLASQHSYHISNLDKFCFICKQEFEELTVHVRTHNCRAICPIVR
jgi:DNA-directed RNA polymerase subunit RPC12/RpoP